MRITLWAAIMVAGSLLSGQSVQAAESSATADAFLTPKMHSGTTRGSASVILRIKDSLSTAQETQLQSLGVDITRHLNLIGSVAATVPGRSLARVAALPFVTHLSADGTVRKCDEFTVGASGAGVAYQQYGLTGAGVTVAVVDSGVECSHWDLLDANGDGHSRVMASKDLVSGYTDWRLFSDPCGHGSHVAGIIAGNGAASTGPQCIHTYYGIARNANLVSARVLDQNGAGSVSTVIAGIQWVVQNKSQYNIRVLNLSLGHPVGESYKTDPLCQAVEAAYRAGIVVVCAAGNSGRANWSQTGGQPNEGWGTAYGSIQSPANDPYVITVGATKSVDGNRWHDRIATYSSRGPSRLDYVLKPDIIAPGNRVVSLDVDWSTLNAAYADTNLTPYSAYTTATASGAAGTLGASNRAAAGMSDAYFCLSGTSMAAPVVAGAAALLLQAYPRLTPDTVKARLMASADKWAAPDVSGNPNGQADPCTYGAGYLNIPAAIQNDIITGQSALSPALYADTRGSVYLDTGQITSGSKSLWGSAELSGPQSVWGSKSIWGSTLPASGAVWDSIVCGDGGGSFRVGSSSVDLSSVAIHGE